MAVYEVRIISVAAQQLRQFIVRDARQHRGPGDLVAVQVKNRKHRAIARGIEEFVGVPAGGQRAGLRFAVADHATGDQAGIVENRAVGVQQRITQLAAFMNGAGRFRRGVAGDAARKRELLEQPLHALGVSGDVGKQFRIRTLQIRVRHHAGPP